MNNSISVAIIDDNPDDAEALSRMMRKLDDFQVRDTHYTEADPALDGLRSSPVDLAFLDYRLNDESCDGLGVLKRAEESGLDVPFIMMTGQGDEYLALEATRNGAADYLVKGRCDPNRLQSTINRVIEHSRSHEREQRARARIKERLSALTTREREVLNALIDGKTSKQIAGKFHRSEQTIKIHRSNLMRKMNANTPAALARMVMTARR